MKGKAKLLLLVLSFLIGVEQLSFAYGETQPNQNFPFFSYEPYLIFFSVMLTIGFLLGVCFYLKGVYEN